MHPTMSNVNQFSVFPFFPSSVIEELKKELPDYLSAAEDVCSEINTIAWRKDCWSKHQENTKIKQKVN